MLQPDLNSIEPCFLIRRDWLARLPMHKRSAIPDYLAHRVSCDSGDLISHVQRIFFVRRLGNPDAVYGALLDLFIALGNRGEDLRGRLLTLLIEALTDAQREALERGLKEGVEATGRFPLSRFSRLSRAAIDGPALVEKQLNTVAEDRHGVLDEARDLIDSGQIETAQSLLEEILLTENQSEEMHRELLNIYRYTHDYDAFYTMRERQQDLPSPLSEAWDELDTHFTENISRRAAGNE